MTPSLAEFLIAYNADDWIVRHWQSDLEFREFIRELAESDDDDDEEVADASESAALDRQVDDDDDA